MGQCCNDDYGEDTVTTLAPPVPTELHEYGLVGLNRGPINHGGSGECPEGLDVTYLYENLWVY